MNRRNRIASLFPRHHALARTLLVVLTIPALGAASAQQVSTTEAQDLDKVMVVTQRAERVSNGATNLDLSIKDTPQSISVVNREQMEQFGANSINDALRLATGIQVEEWETDRTNYLSRGFEIANTQIDGIGLPNGWGIVTGAMDSFGYEKLEVIRGANGLLTGVGNAAGTINYVRKRPSNEEKGTFGISHGTWGLRRGVLDYSTPITNDGTWAVRMVAAHEDRDSYLRSYERERTFLYGVVDGQIGDNGTLTAGYSWQQANSEGNMWGALTYNYLDGSQTSWGSGASTTQDWSYWDTNNRTGFLEYTHQLSSNWRLKAAYNYRRSAGDNQMLFAYSLAGLDPVTGEGLIGWPYKGDEETSANLGTVELSGLYTLFGREQEAMLGLSVGRSEGEVASRVPLSGFGPLPGFPYPGNVVPEPVWGERSAADTLNQRLTRVYGATRVSLSERFKAVLGVNYSDFSRDGVNLSVPFEQGDSHTSPYGGLTWDFSNQVLGYVSYSNIYQPQDQRDINAAYLEPTEGVNLEVGLKVNWLDNRLLTTLALFDARQNDLATYRGLDPASGNYYYEPVDVSSQGVEFEISGNVGEYVNLVLGYTHLEMDDDESGRAYPWVPRDSVNLAISTRLPAYTALSMGVSGRWQGEIRSAPDSYSGYTVSQGSYAVLNAFLGWDIRPDVTLRVNANNLFDHKYIGSLYQVGYYATPRNTMISLDWRF